MTEWLDIVDNDDRVIGKETRKRVHAAGLFHRSAHIVLFNTADQVFVQLRSARKDTNAGLWDTSAAGHVDSAETYLQCAVRELAEELGVRVSPADLSLIGKLKPQQENGFEFTHVYRVVSDQTLTLEQDEIDGGRWLTQAALDSWILNTPEQFTDVFRTIWATCRST